MDRKHLAETVSRRDAVFGGDTQPMPLIFVGQQWAVTNDNHYAYGATPSVLKWTEKLFFIPSKAFI